MTGLGNSSGEMNFPGKSYYPDGYGITPTQNVNLIDQGIDPKPLVLDFCKPQCIYWKEKLERCEK
tara:strand:+ start:74 stop:268 length:195 start_codon:yes stop_codon:yes gene_type:complete